MAKQIEFFITKEDELEFLSMIVGSGNLIVDDKGTSLSLDKAIQSNAVSLFLVTPDSKIVTSDGGFIDVIVSEVIQYSRGIAKVDKLLQSSRLWMQYKYFRNDQTQTTKSKNFDEMFNSYVKWIKKNYTKSKCKKYYIGNSAYKLYTEGYSMLAGPQHTVIF